MANSQIVSLKIEVARQRCEGLARETAHLKNRDYSSQGSNILIEFVEKATESVLAYLQEEETLPDKDFLTDEELEDRIHRVSKLLPFFHYLLGFVEGSEIGVAPVPLVLQLRRLAHSIIPGSEVAISARPQLNYSILEVASRVRAVLNQTPLKDCCAVLPSFLFVVTIPRVESTDVLLHCILSHELGHGLYEKHGLAAKILPKVQIDPDLVHGLASAIVIRLPGTAPPLFEVELRNNITQQVTGRVSKWAQELCSDALGIELFGPAYYFSFIYFSLAFAHLDKESATHPPPRLRLKLMSRILRSLYPATCFKAVVREFIDYWESLSLKPIPIKDAIARIALKGLDQDLVMDSIQGETHSCLDAGQSYSPSRYADDIQRLEPLLINVIPPGEDFIGGQYKPAEMASILNVGWDVFLSELPALSANLPNLETASPYQLRQKLQQLLVKALEISETRLSWEEKKIAAGL
jgi:hypothetical protein